MIHPALWPSVIHWVTGTMKTRVFFPSRSTEGVQPYDKVHKTLLTPLLSGPKGYWSTLDWQVALSNGAKSLDLPFSGEFDFVKTTYVYPTTHMVAPKENVVACSECHTVMRAGWRTWPAFTCRAATAPALIDTLGWLVILGSLVGVSLHGIGRIFTNGNNKK